MKMNTPYEQALKNTNLTRAFKEFYIHGSFHSYLGEFKYHELQNKNDGSILYLNNEQFIKLIEELIYN